MGGSREGRPRTGEAWDEAFSSSRPCLVEFITDPEVLPLPPHISFEQAVNHWRSIFKGDPNAWPMIRQSSKEMAPSYLPEPLLAMAYGNGR